MDAESVLWLDGRRGVYTHAVATRGWWDDVHTNIVPIIDGLRHDNSCAHTLSATVGSLIARPTSQIATCRRPNGTRATSSGATAPQPGTHPHNTGRFRRGWPGRVRAPSILLNFLAVKQVAGPEFAPHAAYAHTDPGTCARNGLRRDGSEVRIPATGSVRATSALRH